MIIIGNSHVSMFRQGLIVQPDSNQPVEVMWVGAITANYFLTHHPAAQKVRTVCTEHPSWKFLSIGMHDNLVLCQASVQNRYLDVLNTLLQQYAAIFTELNVTSKFGWLVAPQQLAGLEHLGLSEDRIFQCARDFVNRHTQWCAENNIPVINPLGEILDDFGYPKKELTQSDGIHLNGKAVKYYLDEITQQTDHPLQYIESTQNTVNHLEPTTEPQSLALLVADELGLPWDDTLVPHGTRTQFEAKLLDFLLKLYRQRGLETTVQRDDDFLATDAIDSLELIELYTYASDLFGMEVDFDVDLRELNTVKALTDFLLAHKPLQKNDFFETLSADTDNPIRTEETLLADAKIAQMPIEIAIRLKEIIQLQTGGGDYCYGIIPFWLALVEMAQEHYATALTLLTQAQNQRLAFPFQSARAATYRKLWQKKEAQMKSGFLKNLSLDDVVTEVPNKVDASLDDQVTQITSALYQHGQNLLAQNSLDDALFAFKKLTEIDPANAMAAYYTGTILQQKNNMDAALNYFKKALSIDASNPKIVISLAEAFATVNQTEQAKMICQAFLKVNPQSEVVQNYYQKLAITFQLFSFVDVLNETRQTAHTRDELIAAGQVLRKKIAQSPQNAVALVDIGKVYYDLQRFEDALIHLQKAIDIDTSLVEAWAGVAVIARQFGDQETYHTITQKFQPLQSVAPGRANGPSQQPAAVNTAFLDQATQFWNVDSMDKAMFERVFVDDNIRKMSMAGKIEAWNRSAVSSVKQILRDLPWQSDWHVLEIGCGVGRLMKPLCQKFAQVDGVDISENMIEYAKQYLADASQNGNLYVNNGYDLQMLPTSQYDFVFSMIVFQHIRSVSVVKSYFSEIARVLKPKGYFRLQAHVNVPGNGTYDEEAESGKSYGLYGNGYTPFELSYLLQQFDFEIVEIKQEGVWIWATVKRTIET